MQKLVSMSAHIPTHPGKAMATASRAMLVTASMPMSMLGRTYFISAVATNRPSANSASAPLRK